MKKLAIFLILLIAALSCSKESKENKIERVSKVDSGNFTEVQTSKNNTKEESQGQKVSYEKEDKAEAKNQNSGFSKQSDGNYAKELENKMEKLEEELQSKLDSGVTSEMINANSELYEAWAELNKVYKLLMERLSKDKKEKLRNSQRAWIKSKEKKANEASKEADGGTLAGVLYSGTLASMTKERTIELAKMYDNLK